MLLSNQGWAVFTVPIYSITGIWEPLCLFILPPIPGNLSIYRNWCHWYNRKWNRGKQLRQHRHFLPWKFVSRGGLWQNWEIPAYFSSMWRILYFANIHSFLFFPPFPPLYIFSSPRCVPFIGERQFALTNDATAPSVTCRLNWEPLSLLTPDRRRSVSCPLPLLRARVA